MINGVKFSFYITQVLCLVVSSQTADTYTGGVGGEAGTNGTEAGTNGTCRSSTDCGPRSECHSISSLCFCTNGASSYPSCSSEAGAECPRPCGPAEFCSAKHKQCMCKHGGFPPNLCCATPCPKFQVCHAGTCECAYGYDTNGVCRKCAKNCKASNGLCKLKDGEYRCVCRGGEPFPHCKTEYCSESCGPGSTCKLEDFNVICTTCRENFQLADGKCVASCSKLCGPLATCKQTKFEVTCTCLGNQILQQGRCVEPSLDCEPECGAGSTCRRSEGKQEVSCTACGSGFTLVDTHCINLKNSWSRWGGWTSCVARRRERRRVCQATRQLCLSDVVEREDCEISPPSPPTLIPPFAVCNNCKIEPKNKWKRQPGRWHAHGGWRGRRKHGRGYGRRDNGIPHGLPEPHGFRGHGWHGHWGH